MNEVPVQIAGTSAEQAESHLDGSLDLLMCNGVNGVFLMKYM